MRKKSAQTSLVDYRNKVAFVSSFLRELETAKLPSAYITEAYDHALVLIFNALEDFLLSICIGIANRSPAKLYEETGVAFGQHLTAEQAAYLITGDDYFSMKGFDGFVKSLRRVDGKDSLLISKCKETKHREAISILVGLRNYAAHDSLQSRAKALEAMKKWEPDRKNLGRAGSWLKVTINGQVRFLRLIEQLDLFVGQIVALQG